jgi:hypothetical protein
MAIIWIFLLIFALILLLFVFLAGIFREKIFNNRLFENGIFAVFKSFFNFIFLNRVPIEDSFSSLKSDLNALDSKKIISAREYDEKSIKKIKENLEKQIKSGVSGGETKTDNGAVNKIIKRRKPEVSDLKKPASFAPKKINSENFFRISSVEALLAELKDKDMGDILRALIKSNYHVKSEFLSRQFKDKEEFLRFLKQDFINFLKSKHETLKQRASSLRRKGLDMGILGFNLMSLLSKIKLFEATFMKKDLEKVIQMIEDIEEELKKFEGDKK